MTTPPTAASHGDAPPAPGADTDTPVGLVLAAGAGRRYGSPKILVPGWLDAAVAALRDGGCGRVVVVTGAARPALPPGCTEAWCPAWADGPGASLATGLAAALAPDAEPAGPPVGVVIRLVDTPDIGADCVARVLAAAGLVAGGNADRATPPAPARATFGGVPGHPVALPAAVALELMGHLAVAGPRRGAGPFLAARDDLRAVDCSDLATGADVDVPAGSGPAAESGGSGTSDTPGDARLTRAGGATGEPTPGAPRSPHHCVPRSGVPPRGLAAEVRLAR